MSRSRSSPRKFSEKIALLNKREADTTAEFEKIIQEVEATTRAPPSPKYLHHHHNHHQQQPAWTNDEPSWIDQDSTSACNDTPIAYYPNGYQSTSPNDQQQQQQQQQFHLDQNQHQANHNQNHHHHHGEHNTQIPTHSQQHYQQQQQQQQQQPSTSSHMGIVPNIEISHTDDEIAPYYHQQQVNHNIVPSDRSSSMSAARSLPDIANLRVNSPNDCLSSSYSDHRLRSNTIGGNNYDIGYNIMQSNEVSQDGTYFCSQQQSHPSPQPEQCFQHQQQPVIIMDNQPSPGTYNEYYHTPQQQPQSSMVRANSYNAVMTNWSTNNNTLYTPKMNNMLSRSSDDCCTNTLDNLDLEGLM